MTATVFAVVLLAALLHALWNALVKGGADTAAAMAAVVFGQGLAGAVLLPVAPPLAQAAWPYLAAGVLLHLGYQLFLMNAYRLGDLTQVYPIARGASPLLVALGAYALLGTRLDAVETTAILLISVGIASISLVRRSDGLFQGKAAALALTTGGFIAAYSLVDGMGARLGGTALGYFGWLAVINALAVALISRAARPGLVRRALAQRRHLVLGGGASFTAYVLVVWAFTQAPIALVTALRETSVIFALLIGVGFLGERLNLAKVAATAMTLTGAILLRLNRG